MKIPRTLTVLVTAASLTLGGVVACGDNDDMIEVAEYEDCDVEDQATRELDCGYWQHPGGIDVATADYQVANDWVWIWFAWVVIGQTSKAPAAWVPPRGVKPSIKIVRMPKSKVCALAAAPRPPAPAPRVNNPAPARPNTNTAPKNTLKPQVLPPRGC